MVYRPQTEITRRPFDRHFAVWTRIVCIPRQPGDAGNGVPFPRGNEGYSAYWIIIGVSPSRRIAQAMERDYVRLAKHSRR